VYAGSAIGVRSEERVKKTRMTRIERFDADPFLVLSAMIRSIRVIRVLLTLTPM
jgi:hypothetical protein